EPAIGTAWSCRRHPAPSPGRSPDCGESTPAVFNLQPGPGSHGGGDGANACDDQERVRHADRVRQCAEYRGTDQGAAKDTDAVQGHHASAHIITRPELQGAGDGNVEKTA